MKPGHLLVLLLVLLLAACQPASPASTPAPEPSLRVGLRASHYGISPFPDADWWITSARDMAGRFDDAAPTVIWIVGTVNDDACWLNFPAPEGVQNGDLPHIIFSPLDDNESYLDRFDREGVRVWLQVEPGSADVVTLIDLVLDRYGAHSSIVGFGVDAEWYRHTVCENGCAVSEQEVIAWAEAVRRHNPRYQLFVKHWLFDRLPLTLHEGIVFIDDSQQFDSLEAMLTEFQMWGNYYAPAPVGFQYGYPADRRWWSQLDDPPAAIGEALRERLSNLSDLYWVDFTAYDLWPQP